MDRIRRKHNPTRYTLRFKNRDYTDAPPDSSVSDIFAADAEAHCPACPRDESAAPISKLVIFF